jgi:tRNA(adenine34) deaminase
VYSKEGKIKTMQKYEYYSVKWNLEMELSANLKPEMDMHRYFMMKALDEAVKAYAMGEAPVGAVIVKDKTIISAAHNEREISLDATRHAEIIAIGRAGKALGSWQLTDCDMYVTLEPCPMCAGALIQARIKTLYLGAPDSKGGAAGSLMNLPEDGRFNHKVKVVRGILTEECSEILKRFFRELR